MSESGSLKRGGVWLVLATSAFSVSCVVGDAEDQLSRPAPEGRGGSSGASSAAGGPSVVSGGSGAEVDGNAGRPSFRQRLPIGRPEASFLGRAGIGGSAAGAGNSGNPTPGGSGGSFASGGAGGQGGSTPKPDLPPTSFDLSRPIESLSTAERDQFCAELVGATPPSLQDPEWVRCVTHFPGICDFPLRSYATCFVQGDCADLDSPQAGIICRPHLDLELGLPGYWLAGSVGDVSLDWRDGWHPRWVQTKEEPRGSFWIDAHWPQGSLQSWQSPSADAHVGLLRVLSEGGGSQRWICLDEATADATVGVNGEALQSSSLSELVCDPGQGLPFEARFEAPVYAHGPVEGTAFGAPLAGWSLAHRFDCMLDLCKLELQRENGSIVALFLAIDEASRSKLNPYYEPRTEYERTEVPFPTAALLTQDGRGAVGCGGAGMLVQEIFGESYLTDSFTEPSHKVVEWRYTYKYTLHIDQLAEPAACPGSPIAGAIGSTRPSWLD